MGFFGSGGGSWSAALSFAAAVSVMAHPAAATTTVDQWDQKAFLGLWEGVDALDGSTVRVSISNVDHDDVLDVLWTESFFSACFEMGGGFSLGRGVATGQGQITRPDLLEVGTTLTCINDANQPEEQDGNTFDFIRTDRVLIISSGGEIFPDIALHRVAR